MATIRYIKRYNKWYVYEVEQYWDKELKKPQQKTKYLGVAKEKDGEYSKPNKNTDTNTQLAVANTTTPSSNALVVVKLHFCPFSVLADSIQLNYPLYQVFSISIIRFSRTMNW